MTKRFSNESILLVSRHADETQVSHLMASLRRDFFLDTDPHRSSYFLNDFLDDYNSSVQYRKDYVVEKLRDGVNHLLRHEDYNFTNLSSVICLEVDDFVLDYSIIRKRRQLGDFDRDYPSLEKLGKHLSSLIDDFYKRNDDFLEKPSDEQLKPHVYSDEDFKAMIEDYKKTGEVRLNIPW